jgi:hypothetical protein
MLIENSPHQGVPLHKHLYEDESFFVLSGIFEITVGGKTTTGGPGTYAYGPRNVPHQWTNMGKGRGQLLNVYTPGGIDKFFLAAGIPIHSPTEQLQIDLAQGALNPMGVWLTSSKSERRAKIAMRRYFSIPDKRRPRHR